MKENSRKLSVPVNIGYDQNIAEIRRRSVPSTCKYTLDKTVTHTNKKDGNSGQNVRNLREKRRKRSSLHAESNEASAAAALLLRRASLRSSSKRKQSLTSSVESHVSGDSSGIDSKGYLSSDSEGGSRRALVTESSSSETNPLGRCKGKYGVESGQLKKRSPLASKLNEDSASSITAKQIKSPISSKGSLTTESLPSNASGKKLPMVSQYAKAKHDGRQLPTSEFENEPNAQAQTYSRDVDKSKGCCSLL